MLSRSFVLGERHRQNFAAKASKQLKNKSNIVIQDFRNKQHFWQQSCHKHNVSSNRTVTTTSTSKNQQKHQHKRDENEFQPNDVSSPYPASSYPASALASVLMSNEKFQARLKHLDLWHSVNTIKRLGHRLATLDPLQMKQPDSLRDLTWSHSLVEQIKSNQDMAPTQAFLNTNQPLMAVNELIDAIWNIYASNDCGLEFSHMSNQNEVEWLTSQWEKLNEFFHLNQEDEFNLAKLLIECETFDHFMGAKYPSTKRYGCEGAESMIIVFDEILRLCHLGESDLDEMTRSIGRIDDVIIGMPHRGRLNLLACLLGFEPSAIFNKTSGECELDSRKAWMVKGDVLSHLSTNIRFVYGLDRDHIGLWRETPDPINVSLLPNPSHLEVASPMVMGAARGRAHNIFYGYSSSPKFVSTLTNEDKLKKREQHCAQEIEHYQKNFSTILPIQVHGDAAVAGQGIIQETLQMSNLPATTVGGSIHLIVNNQIGYTTDSLHGRSSRYCTDIFKLIEAPIIHVNGENIQSVIRATRLALAYRQTFGKDVAIDLICYRRHGHNELDEPAFTQPLMYDAIRNRKSMPQSYCDKIFMEPEQREQIANSFKAKLQASYQRMSSYKPDNDNYRNFSLPTEYHRDHICSWQTGCDINQLKSIALASVETPKNFHVHPTLQRVLVADRQRKFNETNEGALLKTKVDWATAEILAFGSLLMKNDSVRIAGQDVARGTFSTRHAVLYDQNTNEPYIPLNNIKRQTNGKSKKLMAQLEVVNTILSEEAALAYEFGYSLETSSLTVWEAQFGDFFNGAQTVIDTLISSSESKWLKNSPLTLLLPHGLDGAGPEHSSAHLERFLQLSSSSQTSIDTEAKVNWSICSPTLPAQYFHLLRRQVLRPYRKPLVVMSPKIMFRHPDCSSNLEEFGLDKTFEPVLDDPTAIVEREAIDTIVLCSGKVYFTLNEQKQQYSKNNVALVRIEELCPFPVQQIIGILRQYPNVKRNNLVWFQEEHKNQGAYNYVDTRLENLGGIKLKYIGREESELPATGCTISHKKELEQILKKFRSL